jgi:TonB family protein
MDATDVLRDRMREPAGLPYMTTASLLIHGALVAAVLLAPGDWFSQRAQEPRTVMTITLGGGTPGPQNGGMTSSGGRPIQAETPPDAPKRPEAVRPPAAKTPEMSLPTANAKPVKGAPAPLVTQAPDDARGRTPTRGAETSAGTAVAATEVRGQGFGLSTGGGAGSGSRLDVADFCCPDYLVVMIERIRGNWTSHAETTGQAMVKFMINRDGKIGGVAVEESSGNAILDLNAMRALYTTRQLPPLPEAFPNPTLTVHLNFEYQR